MLTTITARTTILGLHHWPNAPEHRAYLGVPHRHEFEATAEVVVGHGDREVEFHDLQDTLRDLLLAGGAPWGAGGVLADFGAQSCEMMAAGLYEDLTTLGYQPVRVTVSEDGQHDGTVYAGAVS
jgi:hypothetical protein